MSAHTPGPWVAGTHYQILTEDKACIADVYGDEHVVADHRLIAAAPDLLKALQAMLTVYHEGECGEMHPDLAENMASAAIAKAVAP